jgi:hypothetical protein
MRKWSISFHARQLYKCKWNAKSDYGGKISLCTSQRQQYCCKKIVSKLSNLRLKTYESYCIRKLKLLSIKKFSLRL